MRHDYTTMFIKVQGDITLQINMASVFCLVGHHPYHLPCKSEHLLIANFKWNKLDDIWAIFITMYYTENLSTCLKA